MVRFFREALRRGPKSPKDIWRDRCRSQERLDKNRTAFTRGERKARFNNALSYGEKLIQGAIQDHGEEIVENLLGELEGNSLGTQLKLLSLSQTESLTYIINALKSLSPETKTDWQYPLSLQRELYRDISESILGQRDGQEQFVKFRQKVEKAMSIPEERYQWRIILELSLDRGLPFMIDALDFIPPDEIFLENIDERLALERKIKELREKPIERKLIFSGEVQGVGFRGHCRRRAEMWGIKGFARNEDDGTVTVLLQGEPSRLEHFHEEISETPNRKVQIEKNRPLGEEVYGRFKTLGGYWGIL